MLSTKCVSQYICRKMSHPPPVSLRVKKQEKYLAKNLALNTHFAVDEIEGLFNMYRQACGMSTLYLKICGNV